MSRSYKKERVVKDKDRTYQKQGSRNIRQKTKQKLKNPNIENEDFDFALPEHKAEGVDPYNITDWIIRDDKKKYFGKGKKKRINK